MRVLNQQSDHYEPVLRRTELRCRQQHKCSTAKISRCRLCHEETCSQNDRASCERLEVYGANEPHDGYVDVRLTFHDNFLNL